MAVITNPWIGDPVRGKLPTMALPEHESPQPGLHSEDSYYPGAPPRRRHATKTPGRFHADLPEMDSLLAVDMGLRTGLALYRRDGKLVWYRSSNFGRRSRLRQGVPGVLEPIPNLLYLVLEGGGPLADIWAREADRRAVEFRRIAAETWRQRLLLPRERGRRLQAKQVADRLSRRVIEWSGAPRPTSLRHDAAEAILIGLWGVMAVGWLRELPPALRH